MMTCAHAGFPRDKVLVESTSTIGRKRAFLRPIVVHLVLDRGDISDRLRKSRLRVVRNCRVSHFGTGVANSTSSRPRQGPRRRIMLNGFVEADDAIQPKTLS